MNVGSTRQTMIQRLSFGINQGETCGEYTEQKVYINSVFKLALTNSSDKRPERPDRKPVSLLASVTYGGTTFDSVVFNLSRKGCNIIIDGEFSDQTVGDAVGLDFAAFGKVGAILRWVQPQEAGLEFVVEDLDIEAFNVWVATQLQSDGPLSGLPTPPTD